jgi:hydroxyacylglutathione hydrolase
LTVRVFTFNPFATNTYLLASEGEAVIVDAASHTPQEHAALVDHVRAGGLTVRHLLLTHAHLDHVYGCAALSDAFGLGWTMHRDDLPFLRAAAQQARMFGAPVPDAPPEPVAFLAEGDTVAFGAATLAVRHVPGHSPGSIAFVSRSPSGGVDEAAGLVVAGDVLFRGSIGRTDLPLGDLPTLMRSIETRLLDLPDRTRVLPGHGPETTVGEERRANPFISDSGLRIAD